MQLTAVRSIALACSLATLSAVSSAQGVFPDLLYYTFDEGGGSMTANFANPGVGANPAMVNGQTLAPAGGQFGGALVGVGGSGTTNYVDTGWITQTNGSFTIAFWLDLTNVTTTNPFMYVCGDQANSLRCFTNGGAGVGNITLRSTAWGNGVVVPGGADATAPHHITFVYDASVPELRGYLDGAFAASASVTATDYTGTSNFRVGCWATVTSLAAGAVLDEFRFFGFALNDMEVAATWNTPLVGSTPPTVYCTSGTTSSGCLPSIGATGTPSATAPNGFTIDVASVEGQKQGLIFYGIDNTGFTPVAWGNGFFCVKAPTQRSLPQSSGGAIGQCDGALSLDWNAYRAANPGALGQPFAAGASVFAQGWFRDPAGAKTTAFSDALEFTVGP